MRGTSNANDRGNTRDRARRREWLMLVFASDVPGCVRCYKCGVLLNGKTLTVDRVKPGTRGGKYTRDNIRPACLPCNADTGGAYWRARNPKWR